MAKMVFVTLTATGDTSAGVNGNAVDISGFQLVGAQFAAESDSSVPSAVYALQGCFDNLTGSTGNYFHIMSHAITTTADMAAISSMVLSTPHGDGRWDIYRCRKVRLRVVTNSISGSKPQCIIALLQDGKVD